MNAPEPIERPRRPGRWKRRLVLSGLGLIALLAVAPLFLGPLLRRLIVGEVEEALAVRARLQSASFAWPARLRLRGLELTDERGARLAALDELAADLRLGALVAGRIEADVALAYPELHVARTPEGAWNWERPLALARERRPAARGADGEDTAPEVSLHLVLTDGHVILHGPQGETTLADIELEVRLEDLAAPAPYHLSLAVRGPSGPAGSLDLAGSFTAASGGRLQRAALAAEARLVLARLDLAAFAPALALVAPVEGLAGVLDGTCELGLAPGLALTGSSTLTLDGLAIEGPLSNGTATRLERVELAARASQDGSGAGTQALELRAESFLSLTYAGTSSLGPDGSGELAGELDVGAELGRLAEVARAWVPFQPGVTLGGRATTRARLSAALLGGTLGRLGLELTGGVEELAAHAADGRALDLSELRAIGLELAAEADLARDRGALSRFALAAGPIRVTAQLAAEGLSSSAPLRALRAGSFEVRADLDRLRGALAELIALDERSFGGELSAAGELSGGEALALQFRVDGKGLALAGGTLTELHGQGEARRSPAGDLAGRGELALGEVGLVQDGRAPLAVPATRLDFELQETAAGAGSHTLTLATTGGDVRLSVAAKTRRDGARVEAEGTLELEGAVATLGRLAEPFAPLQPGLEGRLSGTGRFRAQAQGSEPESLELELDLGCANLAAADDAGVVRRLEALAATQLALEGRFDARAGRAELVALRLGAGGLLLTGSGRLTGLAAGGRAELEDGRLTLECDPDRIGRELPAVLDLGGWTLGGTPLTAEVRLRAPAGRIEAEGRAACASLRLTRPTGVPVELAELALDFGLGYDLGLGSLHVRTAELRTRAATLGLSGTLNELTDRERARGAMRATGTGDLGACLRALGLEGEQGERRLAGAWRGECSVEGDQGSFRLTGKSVLEDFQLALPAREDRSAVEIAEPSIALELTARVALEALDVELERLTLESGLARGGAQGRIENLRGFAREGARLRGLTGSLAYVPDRLGVVLAPWLPGKLSGSEEERVTFTLDGALHELDLVALLSGSQVRLDLGLGRLERPEIVLAGDLALEARDGTVGLRGDLSANEGLLQLDATLVLDQPEGEPLQRSRLSVTSKAVRATAGLAPLLALIHPAFAGASRAQGSLEGLIDLSLDLTYDGPLSIPTLAAGWEALPKSPIHGTGRLTLNGAALRGSPLVAALAGFGVDVGRTLDVRPIEFTVQRGRVSYAKPWTWNFADTETTFTGSLGLDESLDLSWNIPIGAALIERWSFLESLRGETLSLPLRGTVRAPRLEPDELLRGLAARAAQKELEGRLGRGGDGSEDPASILARADELWSRGEKTAAAALYARLREDYKLSLTYALNKDRIKDRSKYQAPK